MPQLIGVILVLILIKLLLDQVKPLFPKPQETQKGDFIDISEKWINSDNLPYQKNLRLLNERETALFSMIQDILVNRPYLIYPRIRLADLVNVPPGSTNRQEYQFRIEERSVDLVIVTAGDFQPLLGINLTSSRDSQRQRISDQFTAQALRAAGLAYITVDLDNPPQRQQLQTDLGNCGLSI